MMSRGKFCQFQLRLEVRRSLNDVLRVFENLLFYGVYD